MAILSNLIIYLKGLKRHYTNADMVKFSRWYLEDYPVFSYVRGQQILVLGYPKSIP